jgi:hypothetical protein
MIIELMAEVKRRYTLNDFSNITFDGFVYSLPEETIRLISDLSSQVGSPTYIKTPVFNKVERNTDTTVGDFKRKRKPLKPIEVLNDDDWETIRTFQATKIVQKEGWEAEMDTIRSSLNKMTEKNYKEQSMIIMDILNRVLSETSEMEKVGNAIFEIASNNRFYSKLYADLYGDLITHFEIMKTVFDRNLTSFLDIFDHIEHANPDENYDDFCRINKNNERRKALSSFFVNGTINKIISVEKMVELNCYLLRNVMQCIKEENKKSEVDEMVENIAILYNKVWFEDDNLEEVLWFMNTIRHLAHSKSKSYPSLSNKSIFKCMDMIEM